MERLLEAMKNEIWWTGTLCPDITRRIPFIDLYSARLGQMYSKLRKRRRN